MRRLLHPFVLVVSAILVVGYVYTATRLTSTAPVRAALAAPFLGERVTRGRLAGAVLVVAGVVALGSA